MHWIKEDRTIPKLILDAVFAKFWNKVVSSDRDRDQWILTWTNQLKEYKILLIFFGFSQVDIHGGRHVHNDKIIRRRIKP